MLPGHLQPLVAECHLALLKNPAFALPPKSRQLLYHKIDPGFPQLNFVREWLAVITAQHVMPLWEEKWPENTFPSQLVEAARGFLLRKVHIAKLQTLADQGWEWLEKLSISPNGEQYGDEFFSAMAAVEAAREAMGRNPLEGEVLDEVEDDNSLDPWTSDTAKWAAAAYAGRIATPTSNTLKRQEFWEWWLTQALPQAWHLGSKS
jgi:hypothetical protein